MSRSGARYALFNAGEGPGFAWVANQWYPTFAAVAAGADAANGLVTALPFYVATTHSFTHIGIDVTVASTAGVCDLGVYNDNGSAYPGALNANVGPTTSTAGTGAITAALAVTLNPGLYWLAVDYSASSVAPTINESAASAYAIFGSLNAGHVGTAAGYRATGQPATLPGTFPGGATAGVVTVVQLQA